MENELIKYIRNNNVEEFKKKTLNNNEINY